MSFERIRRAAKDEKATTIGDLIDLQPIPPDTQHVDTLAEALRTALASGNHAPKNLRRAEFEGVRDRKRVAFERMRSEKKALFAKRYELSVDEYRAQLDALDAHWAKDAAQFDAEAGNLSVE